MVHQLDTATLASIQQLGVKSIRFTIYWHAWSDSVYHSDVSQGLAAAKNLRLLLVLHGEGENLSDYIQFVKEVHRLAPTAALQIWNEVDSPTGPGNGWRHFEGSPSLYRYHLERVREQVPDAFLVSSGLASGGYELAAWVQALNFSPVNAIAVHTYGWPLVQSFRDKFAIARQYTALPIWNTEFGMEQEVLPVEVRYLWPEEQEKQLDMAARYVDLYDQAFVFVLTDGQNTGHSLTPGSLRWLREWNLNSAER